jgi:hypothetical protein
LRKGIEETKRESQRGRQMRLIRDVVMESEKGEIKLL